MTARRLLIVADMSCRKQTFIAACVTAVKGLGLDYRMMLTRGREGDTDLDQALADEVDIEPQARLSDFLSLPLLVWAFLVQPRTAWFLRASVRRQLGWRLMLSDARMKYAAFRKVARWRPQALLVHFCWNLPISLALAEAIGVPLAVVAHGSDILRAGGWKDQLRHPNITEILCVSDTLVAHVRQNLGTGAPPVRLLRNALAPQFFEPSHPAPDDHIRIVCIAAFRRLKNHAWLLRALKQLKARGTDFSCDLVGDAFPGEDNLQADLKQMVADYGLQGRVQFTGWLPPEETRNRLDSANMLVLPSESEGFPTVVTEALARCRVVVGTDIAGIREATADGKYGILCPLDDDKALADALAAAFERSRKDHDLLMEGRAWIAAQAAPDPYAENLARCLGSLL